MRCGARKRREPGVTGIPVSGPICLSSHSTTSGSGIATTNCLPRRCRTACSRRSQQECPNSTVVPSGWYEQHQLFAEAVTHALAVPDIKRAARLIEQHGYSFALPGQLSTIAGLARTDFLMRCPTHPRLCLLHAFVLLLTQSDRGVFCSSPAPSNSYPEWRFLRRGNSVPCWVRWPLTRRYIVPLLWRLRGKCPVCQSSIGPLAGDRRVQAELGRVPF